MPRHTLIHRWLQWDGKSGSAQFGDTKHAFTESPWIGVPDMLEVEYVPHRGIHLIRQGEADKRPMTAEECIDAENRLYAMNRGAGDPWRKEWKR